MPPPPPKQKVFVAWDHSVPDYGIELNEIAEGRPQLKLAYSLRRCDGSDPQGSIGPGVLRDIDESNYLLAFLERPNCNVLFEAGYALGRGMPVSLRVYSVHTRDRWIRQIRWLHALPINPLPPNPRHPRIALERFDDALAQPAWQRPAPTTSVTRTGTLALCPTENPGRTIRETIDDPDRSRLHETVLWPRGNSSCEKLLDSIDRVQRLVWIMPGLTLPDASHLPEESRYRDHPENAAHAFLAGYAHARGVSLVFCPQQTFCLRPLLDLQLNGLEVIEWLNVSDLILSLSSHLGPP